MKTVEGGDEMPAADQEGAASTYDAGGLNGNSPGGAPATDEVDMLLDKLAIPRNLPSIVDIKKELPRHVFRSSLSTSMYYAIKDATQIVGLFLVAEWVWSSGLLPSWVLLALLPGYLLLQGTFFTAFFVLGHDTGHNSFSRYSWLNDVMGSIFHTFLLIPYYSLKLSHRRHHNHTGNLDKDEVYFPVRKKQHKDRYLVPGFGLGVSWFVYLLAGYAYGPRPVSHFNPWHAQHKRHVLPCLVSIGLVVAWMAVLWQYALKAGFLKLFVHFIVPDLVFGTYLVVITFLQHSEVGVPWYADSEWSYVRGQLSSVDRDFGWCNSILHSVGTHQVHHLFPKVPHYHLGEATRVFRAKFPQLAQVREDRILPAFCRMFAKFASQHVVPDDIKVHVYQ